MLASHDDDAISDEELLTGTGSGGVFASGYLRDKPLIEYLGESERVSHLLSNKKKGVRRETDDDSTAFTPGDDYRAIAAVTDTRVLFVVGGCDDGDEMFGVPYTEIEDVKTNRGVLKKSVDVWTTSGVRWRFYVRSSVDLRSAAEYLERAAVVWSRVESQLQHARKHIAAISDHTSERDHEAAREAAKNAREYVEEAQRKATELTEDRADAIWERIQLTEQRLDEGALNIHVSRAKADVASAERLWRQEQYNDAYDAYLAARNQYERALDLARERDLSVADDIRARADQVTQSIDRLSKSPLQRAEETFEEATAATELSTRVDLLADALEKYQSALVLDWGNDTQRFAGDSDEIRTTIEAVVDELVGARRELADKHWRAGNWYSDAGQFDQAREELTAAREHVDAALTVAEELKPGLTAELAAAKRELDADLDRVGTDDADDAAPDDDETDEPSVRDRVTRLWTERDWETTHDREGVVDVVATREAPIPEKQLLVVEERSPDGECDQSVVESAVAVRDADGDADVVVVVTNGSFTERARSLAREHNVKLLDGERLDEALDAAGFATTDV
nr:restriction endonuclease [Halorientalis brevis]